VNAVALESELLATSYGRAPTRLRIRFQSFDLAARRRRARAASGRLAGFALVALFIPPIHAVGALLMLSIAAVVGLRRLRQHTLVEALAGPCPACRRPQDFPAPRRGELPVTVACPGCREFVKISVAADDLG
jgi:hypothetical protein